MRSMPSMRLLAMAGAAARRNNVAIYNCSYQPVESIDSFCEALLISMAGNGFDADCWASAAEIPNARIGPRTVDASRQLRRRCAATMAEDMARTSV